MLGDSLPLIFVGLLLIWVLITFIRERWSPDVVVAIAVAVLLISQLLSPHEVLSVLSNPAPVSIACMFILSASLERTGCVDILGNYLGKLVGGNPFYILSGLTLTALILSAGLNSAPVVAVLTPIAISLARRAHFMPSRLLIPLSYATILGGTVTMIGTSTNLLVDGVSRKAGLEPFSIFEITGAGLVLAFIGMSYILLFGRKLLPDRDTLSHQLCTNLERTFITELLVPKHSSMIGKTLKEARLTHECGVKVVKLFRHDSELTEPTDQTKLTSGDRLVLHGQIKNVVALRGNNQLTFQHDNDFQTISSRNVIFAEAIVGRNSRYSHRPMQDLDLTARYGIIVLAVHRQDENIQRNLDKFQLSFGDVLLVEGTPVQIKRFASNGDLISLTAIQERTYRKKKAPIAILATLSVMLLASIGIMPIEGLTIIGATTVIATRCLDTDEAYKAIDWKIIGLILGMLAISIAMHKVGLVTLLARHIIEYMPWAGPAMMLSFIYLFTSILTEMLSSNAVAVLVTPIAIGIAQHLGVDPRPFVVAVMFSASASFATPIGYQTNTFVYNAGGYRFTDFIKIGIPLNILLWLSSSFIIPLFWPFTPT